VEMNVIWVTRQPGSILCSFAFLNAAHFALNVVMKAIETSNETHQFAGKWNVKMRAHSTLLSLHFQLTSFLDG